MAFWLKTSVKGTDEGGAAYARKAEGLSTYTRWGDTSPPPKKTLDPLEVFRQNVRKRNCS